MKSTLVSSAIFIFLIMTILFSINYLDKMCIRYEKISYTLEDYISKEDWKKAYDTSYDFVKSWEESSDKISMFIHHADIDNIDTELLKLTQYTKVKNKDEALSSIHVVKFFLKHIRDSEKINLQNIF